MGSEVMAFTSNIKFEVKGTHRVNFVRRDKNLRIDYDLDCAGSNLLEVKSIIKSRIAAFSCSGVSRKLCPASLQIISRFGPMAAAYSLVALLNGMRLSLSP